MAGVVLIKWGVISAAGDITMAAIVRTAGSQTREAIIDLIEPIAAQIIKDDPTIIAAAEQAAEEAVAQEIASAGVIIGIPTSPVGVSTRTTLPISWIHRVMSSPYASTYSATYDGVWNGSSRFGKNIPLLDDAKQTVADAVIPDTIARKSDIPVVPPIPSATLGERAVSSVVPIFGARVASAAADSTACAVVMVGSSTTSRMPGFVVRLAQFVQRTFVVSNQSAVQASSTATFTKNNDPGIHVYNAGEPNTTSVNYLTNAEIDLIAALQPALVQHMVGSNDYQFGRSPADYKAQIEAKLAYFDSVLTVPCQHVLVQPYQRMDVTNPAYPWADYGLALKQIADARANTVYVDINDAYVANGVPGSDPLNLIDTDNIHQTARGDRFMADLLSGFYLA